MSSRLTTHGPLPPLPGAAEHSVALKDVDMGMALLSVQLLELVLADFPTDTQARRVRPPTRGWEKRHTR